MVLWLGGLSLTSLAAVPMNAQRARDARLAPVAVGWAPPEAGDTTRVPLPAGSYEINVGDGIVGGLLGGAVGGVAGYGAAILIVRSKRCSGNDEFCGLGDALLSIVVGESIGLAVGAHYGSRGRGSLVGASLASAGVGVAGSVLAVLSGGPALVLVPVAQLATVLLLEHP